MARIPETTWLIKEMRRSDATAVLKRSEAPAEDNPAKYGKRKNRKMTAIRDCQPTKKTSNNVIAMSSNNADGPFKNLLTVSSSNR